MPRELLRAVLRRPFHPDGWRIRILSAVPAGVAAIAFADDRSYLALVAFTVAGWLAFYLLVRLNLLVGRVSDIRGQLLSMWGLLGLLSPKQRLLPALGDFALDAPRSHALLREVVQKEPRVVVELGPGASTVLLSMISGSLSARFELYSVEHDERFVEEMRALVRYHEMHDVHLIEARLEYQRFGEWSGQWYRTGVSGDLPGNIDFLVVDGPPGYLGPMSRYPALPALRAQLSDGAVIFVDDAERSGERKIIARWLQDDRTLRVKNDGGSYLVLTTQG